MGKMRLDGQGCTLDCHITGALRVRQLHVRMNKRVLRCKLSLSPVMCLMNQGCK